MKRRWFRRWMIPVGIVVAFAITAILLDFNAERQFQHEVDLARKAGLVTRPSDLKSTLIPERENAAPPYRLALDKLKKADPTLISKIGWFEFGMSDARVAALGRPQTKEEMRTAVEAMRVAFPDALEGLRRPTLDLQRDWDNAGLMLFPEVHPLKSIAKGLCIDGYLKASTGDTVGAMDRIRQARRMAEHLMQEPTMIAQEAGSRVLNFSDEAVIAMAINPDAKPDMLAAAQKHFAGETSVLDIRKGMRTQGFLMTTMLDAFQKNPADLGFKDDDLPPLEPKRLLGITWIKRSAQTILVRAHRRASEKLPRDPRDWESARKVLDELEFELDESPVARWTQFWGYGYQKAAYEIGFTLQRRRLAHVACVLQAIRLRTGSYPASLPEMGDDTIDLFDKASKIKYHVTPKGFKLYSVWSNGVDDGGSTANDLVISLEGGRLLLNSNRY